MPNASVFCTTKVLHEMQHRKYLSKILLNLSRFNEQSSFSTWVYSITYNYCIDIIRKKKKVQLIFTEDIGNVSKEAEIEVPDSVLLEMKHDRLQKILELIPPGDKAVLMMKYKDDMSIKEMADGLGKTESAIKMQIMRAKIRAQIEYERIFKYTPLENESFQNNEASN